jgi:acylphosphatase
MSDLTELQATVRGYVQGVGFRAFVRRRALALGLVGYVRNTEDGDVEVVAQGPRRDLEVLLSELQRGPSESEVSSVDYAWRPARNRYLGFDIRY